MRGLLGDSASSPPRDDPCQYLVTSSPGIRGGIEEAARQGKFDDLGSSAYSNTWIITTRYCRTGNSVEYFEPILRDLWYVYYQGSKYLSHKSAEHDRWVLDLLRTRGRGPLIRPSPIGSDIDVARTPAGTLWNDLPFFVMDMTDFWMNDCAIMDATQRLNFASFLAKLTSTRLDKDQLCQIALLVLRDTFETIRELVRPNDSDGADPSRMIQQVSIAALLPAACAWIHEAGCNIILLTDVSWNECPRVIGQGGETFVQSELGKQAPAGFSPWRWMYWLKRLHEIRNEAEQGSEKEVVEHASKAIDVMLQHVEERNSKVIRVFGAAGEQLHQDKDFAGLKKLIKEDQSSE